MYMQFNGDFIGYEYPGISDEFISGDSLEKFLDNLKTMPDDWYYRDKRISYNFNELGHRSISIKELDFNNYILFVGCSHTLGTGLELETTYPYLVSQKLKIPYYNLGIGAIGIDTLFYNLVTWLTKFNKPKAIVIQWPDISRFILVGKNSGNILPIGVWTVKQGDEKIKTFYNAALDIPYFETKCLLTYKLISALCKDKGVPLIQFCLPMNTYMENVDSVIKFLPKNNDMARDGRHYGIKSHEKFANLIVEEYNKI